MFAPNLLFYTTHNHGFARILLLPRKDKKCHTFTIIFSHNIDFWLWLQVGHLWMDMSKYCRIFA